MSHKNVWDSARDDIVKAAKARMGLARLGAAVAFIIIAMILAYAVTLLMTLSVAAVMLATITAAAELIMLAVRGMYRLIAGATLENRSRRQVASCHKKLLLLRCEISELRERCEGFRPEDRPIAEASLSKFFDKESRLEFRMRWAALAWIDALANQQDRLMRARSRLLREFSEIDQQKLSAQLCQNSTQLTEIEQMIHAIGTDFGVTPDPPGLRTWRMYPSLSGSLLSDLKWAAVFGLAIGTPVMFTAIWQYWHQGSGFPFSDYMDYSAACLRNFPLFVLFSQEAWLIGGLVFVACVGHLIFTGVKTRRKV